MPTLSDLDDMVRAFQRSRLILTAVELDVFTAVGSGATAHAVATRIGADPEAATVLLNALAGLGLLTKSGDTFACAEVARQHLVEGCPQDSRASFRHGVRLWEHWSELTTIVRTGERPASPARRDQGLPLRPFIGAMHQYALEQAGAFLAALDLRGVRSVVDLGGGSGAYAMAFAKALPAARIVLFDRADVVRLAEDYIRQGGMADRIETRTGDILEHDFGSGYDLVWMSNVVHAWGPQEVRRGLRKVAVALAPGGRLLLRDFLLDDDKTTPLPGAIFALNMLVSTAQGGCYSRAEYGQWLREAGFGSVRLIPVSGGGSTGLMEAIKEV